MEGFKTRQIGNMLTPKMEPKAARKWLQWVWLTLFGLACGTVVGVAIMASEVAG